MPEEKEQEETTITALETIEDFEIEVKRIVKLKSYREPLGFGICKIKKKPGKTDETSYAKFMYHNWGENSKVAAIFFSCLGIESSKVTGSEMVFKLDQQWVMEAIGDFNPFIKDVKEAGEHPNIDIVRYLASLIKMAASTTNDPHRPDNVPTADELLDEFRLVFIYTDEKCQSVEVAYLKLEAISRNKVSSHHIGKHKPDDYPVTTGILNIDGIDDLLPTMAWTTSGPVDLGWLRRNEHILKLQNQYPHILYVDKYPRYVDCIVPPVDANYKLISNIVLGYPVTEPSKS